MEAVVTENTENEKTKVGSLIKDTVYQNVPSTIYSAPEERSFARQTAPRKEPKPFVMEFTNDPALLTQYYYLRTRMFISVWGLEDFHGEEDAFDPISETLVARVGNFAVGGGRLTFSYPDNPYRLPMEGDDFSLVEALPELNLEDKIYGECSRLAVLPEYRGRKLSLEMWRLFVNYALSINTEYGFWIAPALQARNNRSIAKILDVPCTIRADVEIPEREEYEGIKMYLGVLDFTKIKNRKDKAMRITMPESELVS